MQNQNLQPFTNKSIQMGSKKKKTYKTPQDRNDMFSFGELKKCV